MNIIPPLVTPQLLLGEAYQAVVSLMATHSPFPCGQANFFSQAAKMRAARIHLDETVFFGQVAYHDLTPSTTVEICAAFGIPTITMGKLFGVEGTCVDSDMHKLAVGKTISAKLGVTLTWEQTDLFGFLRQNAQGFRGKTLLATAAYCRDKKKGTPMGSGEKDIVEFARNNRINLALFPFRSSDIIQKGVSNERKRVETYEQILVEAGYTVRKHSTELLFRGQGAPDWFFLDILTAKCTP
jgi:hypothetical protein